MTDLLDVIQVDPRKDYTLQLLFENQKQLTFDMAPYLNKKPFNQLKELSLFMQAKIGYGTVVWPGNIDIAPETLWDGSVKTG